MSGGLGHTGTQLPGPRAGAEGCRRPRGAKTPCAESGAWGAGAPRGWRGPDPHKPINPSYWNGYHLNALDI
jgi:hypothetical protein